MDILTDAIPQAQNGCAMTPQKAEFSKPAIVNLDRSPFQEGKVHSMLLKKRAVLMTTRTYTKREYKRSTGAEKPYVTYCADVIVGQHSKYREAASP